MIEVSQNIMEVVKGILKEMTMFGVKKKRTIAKIVKNEILTEAAAHAQALAIPAAVTTAARSLSKSVGSIYIYGWFYKIITIDVKKLLKKKKVKKPIEAEFYSHTDQNAETEKAKTISDWDRSNIASF